MIPDLQLMSSRRVGRIDYSVYHSTGEKAQRIDQEIVTKMGDKVVEELKIQEDIRHSLEIYADVATYDTKEEIDEGVVTMNDISRAYRHIHVELKSELEPDEYVQKYPDYEKTVKAHE